MDENSNPKTKYSVLEIGEVKYNTLFTKKYLNRKPYIPKNPKQIVSFIPGIIKKIYVKTGSKVKAGDKLLVLEAMKMNNDIIAQTSGKIQKINVKTGDHVPKNFVLVEIK